MRIISFAICLFLHNLYKVVLRCSLLCTARKFSFRVSVRIIPAHRKDRHKRPVLVHGAAIYAAKRTFSAARLSDILHGSYRLAPQSPVSSQCRRALQAQKPGIPAKACLFYPIPSRLSRGFLHFFLNFFTEGALPQKCPAGTGRAYLIIRRHTER